MYRVAHFLPEFTLAEEATETPVLLKKISPALVAVATIFALSGCGSADNVGISGDDVSVSGTDSTEVTCDRFNEVNGKFNDTDLQSMELDEIAGYFSEGITEIETVSSDAENVELAQSINTMADTMRSSVSSAEGDLDSIHSRFQEELQGVDVQDAAAHLDETCDARMNL